MTHEELQQLLNEDITPQPTPDPAWDYYQIWDNLNKVKDEIDEIIGFISYLKTLATHRMKKSKIG